MPFHAIKPLSRAIKSLECSVQGGAGHDQLVPGHEDEVRDAQVAGGDREGLGLPHGRLHWP